MAEPTLGGTASAPTAAERGSGRAAAGGAAATGGQQAAERKKAGAGRPSSASRQQEQQLQRTQLDTITAQLALLVNGQSAVDARLRALEAGHLSKATGPAHVPVGSAVPLVIPPLQGPPLAGQRASPGTYLGGAGGTPLLGEDARSLGGDPRTIVTSLVGDVHDIRGGELDGRAIAERRLAAATAGRPPGAVAGETEVGQLVRMLAEAIGEKRREPDVGLIDGSAASGDISGARGASAYAKEKQKFEMDGEAAWMDGRRRAREMLGREASAPTKFVHLLSELPWGSYNTARRAS